MRALVFRSAYSASRNARASAAFAASIKAHCAVSSETLMLQVRCANPPMPHRTSSLSCSGVPVGLLATSAPSRLSARWRSVRLIGCLRTIPPYGVLAFRSAYWLRQTLELQSLRDLRQAQTLDLQVRFAHPSSTQGRRTYAVSLAPLCKGGIRSAVPLAPLYKGSWRVSA